MIGAGSDSEPHWERFRAEVLANHPEWDPHFHIANDRFFLEITSEHPVIKAPLTVEIPDREPGGSIDVYWDDYFEHVFMRRDLPSEQALQEQFTRVIGMVEEWTDDSKVFSFWYEMESGRKARWGRLDYPLTGDVTARASSLGQRIVYWSWRGSHDGELSP